VPCSLAAKDAVIAKTPPATMAAKIGRLLFMISSPEDCLSMRDRGASVTAMQPEGYQVENLKT
jgi:hypothetical protein